MATTREEILGRLRADKAALDRFGVSSVAIFGSCARGDARIDSDVDILVDYRRDVRPDLFDFIDLQDHLQGLLGRRVDLVTPEALDNPLRARILAEAAYA
jgi:hypothetical protein